MEKMDRQQAWWWWSAGVCGSVALSVYRSAGVCHRNRVSVAVWYRQGEVCGSVWSVWSATDHYRHWEFSRWMVQFKWKKLLSTPLCYPIHLWRIGSCDQTQPLWLYWPVLALRSKFDCKANTAYLCRLDQSPWLHSEVYNLAFIKSQQLLWSQFFRKSNG